MLDVSNEVAAELAGVEDGVLDALRERLACTIALRGNRLTLGGDDENVAAARAGVYDAVEITPVLRRRAQWERRDLVHDPPPPGRFDLIMCRNVAIYLDPAAKSRLHRMLAGALAPGGVLMLGRSERLGDPAALGLRRAEPHVYERPR